MTTNAIIRVQQHGGPECLSLDELPLEPLQPEHLLVEIQAAGVNFFDTQLRSGLYKQPLPLALGNEGAGIVREAGPMPAATPWRTRATTRGLCRRISGTGISSTPCDTLN